MKIYRVNIVDPGSAKTTSHAQRTGKKCEDVIGINQRNHEPIGACYVAAYLAKKGFETNIVYPRSDNLSVAEAVKGNPQIVAFSCLTYNYPLAKELAKKIRSEYPKIITAIGGYHATCVPEQICKEKTESGKFLFDLVIAQEADWTLSDLAEFLNDKREHRDIRGKIYGGGKLQIDNFSRIDPNLNPIPLRTKEMMLDRRRQGLYYPAPSQQKAVALFVWSRGCPYNCQFCISAKMFPHCQGESPVKYRKIDNIIEEVRLCQKEFGTNYGFAVDLNFYGGDKKRMRRLCSELKKTGLKWYAMSRLDVDPELFEIMKMGGCTMVGIGVESLTNQHKSGAKMNITEWKQKAKDVAELMKGLGILTKFYYILGGAGETINDIKAEGEAICEVYSDEIRCSWMTFSPGTPMFEELQKNGGLEMDGQDLSLFSTDYPTIRVPGADAEALQQLRMDIYRKFYSPERYGPHAKSMITMYPYLKRSFNEWNEILKTSLGVGWKK